MKRILLTLSFVICHLSFCFAQQTEVTTQEAKNLYKNTAKRRVSVHDPSVVYEPSTKRYYIFGSHRGCAYTTDMQNWTGASFTWKAGTNTNAGIGSAQLDKGQEITKYDDFGSRGENGDWDD